ncbi:MAG: hypothetical protein HZA66_17880 [Rhodopseudomonas palustris]|uniref:Uncharacterized protein n=1 Tax=Rhodopseudomonas palustris TaxID=1076 RepID=A0A933S1F7_RHOPL|nr:hypothetical protein [Rhodopseudomonas palustris]
MTLSIVRCDGPDADGPPDAPPLSADLVVLSFSDAALARYARVWHGTGQQLPALYLANISRPLPPQALRDTAAAARGVLVHLPEGLDDWRDGIETLVALARDQRIALAVIADQPDPRLDALSNLPRTTLRRLASLCRGSDDQAARAVLTQLSLAAGLTIEPWLDQAASPIDCAAQGDGHPAAAEPIRGMLR